MNQVDATPASASVDYNLNSSFGNIQIDLDNLGAILGSTSITVCKPVTPGPTSPSNIKGESSSQLKQNTETEPSDYK